MEMDYFYWMWRGGGNNSKGRRRFTLVAEQLCHAQRAPLPLGDPRPLNTSPCADAERAARGAASANPHSLVFVPASPSHRSHPLAHCVFRKTVNPSGSRTQLPLPY